MSLKVGDLGKRSKSWGTKNPLLVEKVKNPTLFAKIQLLVQTQCSSKYSLALYEFLLDEVCRAGSPKTHMVQVPLDTVRYVLQFDGIYKHLNNDVLKPCVLEINKNSDISVGYRGIKKGRAVADLLFMVERTVMQMPLDGLMVLEEAEESTIEAPRPQDLLVVTLVEKGIEEDYRPKIPQNEAATARERESRQRAFDELAGEWNRYRERRVRERFLELEPEDQEAHRTAFVERLGGGNPLIHKYYKKEGFKSRMVEAQFFVDLREQLLASPEELSCDAYQAWRRST